MDSISDEIAGNTDSAAPQATYDNLSGAVSFARYALHLANRRDQPDHGRNYLL